MKYLKKVMCFFMTAILILIVSGCGTKSPSKAISEKLNSIKNGNNQTISEVLNSEISQEKTDDSEYIESKNKMIDSVKKITYKINSETVEGDTATVNITVNGPDLADAFSKFMQKAFSDALSNAFSGNTETQEEIDAKYDKIFSEILENMNFSDRTMDVEMVKENKEWKVKDYNDIIKLIINIDPDTFGNTLDSSNDKASDNEIKEMKLNEPFTVETEHGNYNLTMEGVRTTDKRNEFSDKSPVKVVFLDYTYENISFGADTNQDLYIDEYAFQVLDDDGNVLDTYPVYDENRTTKNTPIGGRCQASATYGVNTDSKNLNVTFTRGSQKVSRIIIPIQ